MEPGERVPSQNPCTKRGHRISGDQNEPAIDVIGRVAAGKNEHHERQELHQAQVPEIQRIMRERVDLPADSNAQHLPAERRTKFSCCVRRIATVTQDGKRVRH